MDSQSQIPHFQEIFNEGTNQKSVFHCRTCVRSYNNRQAFMPNMDHLNLSGFMKDWWFMKNWKTEKKEKKRKSVKPCGFECLIYFSVLQNVATTYPGKTHTRKTVQVRCMRIFSCYKSWSKTACCKFASKRRGRNASFLTNFLLLLQRVCNSFLYQIL